MWADNETDIDLLGFDYLVDQLEVVLTDPALRPVTVGALGDWGSGKTSLMFMAASRLRSTGKYAVATFSPWRYESTDLVKRELISTVLRQLDRWVERTAGGEHDAGRLERAHAALLRAWTLLPRVASKAAPAAGAITAIAAGAPAELGAAAGTAAAAAVDAIAPSDEPQPTERAEDPVEFTSANEFHDALKRVLADVEGLDGLIVLIDDLDRCAPDTIIETFETLRLFLHVPKTAYVVAAHPQIVEAAVSFRYAGSREGDQNLGRDYLEKIIHLPITIPPLSQPEVESYINLLFAQLLLSSEEFEALRAAADARRADEPLGVAMNYGVAADVLGEVPDELQAAFTLSGRIGPILGQGLRGNPRQIKRFLNSFRLRQLTAERRKAGLDPAILAKLMVLELEREDFQRLFEWQIEQDGLPEELAQAEAIVRDGQELDGTGDEVRAWAAKPAVARWLALDPALAGVSLGTYFYFSRDTLSPVAGASRLTGAQQALLARLQVEPGAQRSAAVDETAALGTVDLTGLYGALLERLQRDPKGRATRSAIELAARVPTLLPALAAALGGIAPKAVPPTVPPTMALAFGGSVPDELSAVLDRWERDGSGPLKAAVRKARK